MVEEGRTARKRGAIVEAARKLFLRNGYAGTSMDEVAAHAHVSKQTVYKNFLDKQSLFTELITSDIGQIEGPEHPLIEGMPHTDDVERDLRLFARHHLSIVMQPDLLRMRRVIIGEADRFPELAQAWYQNGPVRSAALFATWFQALHERGLLHVDDPEMAAQMFNWLVLSIPVNRAMACPLDETLYSDEELDRIAAEAVRVFLAAYGPKGSASRR